MPNTFRQWLHRFIPSQIRDPIGLTRRLFRTGDPAAFFAMQTALLGLALAPLDLALQVAEDRKTRRAGAPTRPMVFICGAPRSGTTLVHQVLINNLPVAYVNNLTAVFPRAPLTANRIFRPAIPPNGFSHHSYYGKTDGFAGPNDGLHLWDRWFGTDRTRVRTALTAEEQRQMRQFFGAMQQQYDKPVVAKNNMLNACASLVADVLDTAYFICMSREPLLLAQSQLQARIEINGGDDLPYGLAGTRRLDLDPDEDVCRQVLFHHHMAVTQQRLVGADRFWIVRYESFCRNPSALVEAVASKILGQDPSNGKRLAAFPVSDQVRIDPQRFRRLAATLSRLGHPDSDVLASTMLSEGPPKISA